MIWLWIFLCGYVAPMLFLIFVYSVYENENPFDKENRGRVLTPFKNLFLALVLIFTFITVILIEFGDFCEDVGKAFKKNFG